MNTNTNALAPAFRFPEFLKSGPWVMVKLSHILNYERPDKFIVGSTDYVNKGTPVLTANKSFILGYTDEQDGIYRDLPAIIFDDFTVQHRFVTFPFKVKSSAIKILKNKRPKDSLKFIHELLLLINYDAKDHRRYYISTYQDFEVPFPTHPQEQQRIAEALESIDGLILTHQAQLAHLENHQRSLIDGLFPQKAETAPKFRFPEFKDAPSWRKKNLGTEADFFKGRGISKSQISADGQWPCIRYGELYTRYGEQIDEVFSRTDVDQAELFFSVANDVIIPASGETQIDIATASCVLHDDIALGGDLNVIRSSINGVFLAYYLNKVKKNEIAQMAQGNAVVHLYAHQLKTLNLLIPEPLEQSMIAECLTNLDELINSQKSKIALLERHKKSLRWKLFPKFSI